MAIWIVIIASTGILPTCITWSKKPGVTVWCGISSVGIIGPYFFDGCVNGKSYLEMLKHFLIPRLAAGHYDDDVMFQQDGAPPHFATAVREFLHEKFPGRWIGRRGPIEWPARSPDLTPADFYLWGVLKDKVYCRNPMTLDQLSLVISEQIQTIDVNLCRKVCRSVRDRMAMCIRNDGGHFEHLLWSSFCSSHFPVIIKWKTTLTMNFALLF